MGYLVGYEHLREALHLSAFAVQQPARVGRVGKITTSEGGLLVPAAVAPARDASIVEHALFALKHEGINLQILSMAVAHMDADSLAALVQSNPRGVHVRKLCSLWEAFTQREIVATPAPVAAVELFPPQHYLTSSNAPRSRWGVLMNGLGTIGGVHGYCPTVRRTRDIESGLQSGLFDHLRQFNEESDPDLVRRTVAWAYLSETKSSYQIERETPSQGKAEKFMRMLAHAHAPGCIDEDMLAELQRAIVSNPHAQSFEFRQEQNWLSNGGHGLLGVTYVPPAPDALPDLMQGWMDMSNALTRDAAVDPMVGASLASFGFVFAHPFMDGNGRLSRYLLHRHLCQSGAIAEGAMLPVSTAIARHEGEYLQALRSFSAAAREFWSGRWIGGQDMRLNFVGDINMYRYWDATACTEFGMRMAQEALEKDLYQESRFLQNFDQLKAAVNAQFDVPDKELCILVRGCLSGNGVVSNNLRKKFAYAVMQQDGIFEYMQEVAAELLQGPDQQPGAEASRSPRP